MKRLLTIAIFILLSSLAAFANGNAQGWCTSGAQPVTTAGLVSSTLVQGSFPQCTVTVNISGGGLATIYADNATPPTPLGNPFQATTNGQFRFYAIDGRYDVILSGAGFPTPVTYTDVIIIDPSLGGLGQTLAPCIITFSSTPVFNVTGCLAEVITLTGNVSSSTIIGGTLGQVITFSVSQGSGGPWTFNWPTNMLNPPLITPTAGAAMQASFILLADNLWHHVSIGESQVFDTAVNGNVLKVNGSTINAFTGTGSTVVLQNTPTLTTPILTSPTVNFGLVLSGGSSGTTTLQALGVASGTASFPANTGTVAELNLPQTWTAKQTFTAGIVAGGTVSLFQTNNASNNDVAGELTMAGGTVTYLWANTYLTHPECTATDQTSIAAVKVIYTGVTSVTFSTAGASDLISYICVGRT